MAGVWHCMLAAVVLMCVSMWDPTEAVGGARSRPRPQRRPPKKPKVEPTDVTPLAQNIDMERMMGKWYLLIAASKCSYLMNHGTKVEPTVMTLARSSDQTLSVSTKTRHNHQCWEILQVYDRLPTPGKLVLKGMRAELNTNIVIVETDYSSYAIMYYQKRGKITMKLYGRSVDNLSEPMLTKFEQLAEKQNMGLAFLFPFPTYSHCGDVDKDHIINWAADPKSLVCIWDANDDHNNQDTAKFSLKAVKTGFLSTVSPHAEGAGVPADTSSSAVLSRPCTDLLDAMNLLKTLL